MRKRLARSRGGRKKEGAGEGRAGENVGRKENREKDI